MRGTYGWAQPVVAQLHVKVKVRTQESGGERPEGRGVREVYTLLGAGGDKAGVSHGSVSCASQWLASEHRADNSQRCQVRTSLREGSKVRPLESVRVAGVHG